MDGYWQLNNDYTLNSLRIGPFPSRTKIQNLRIAGPKGEKIIESFDSISDDLVIELVQGEGRVKLTGRMRDIACKRVEDGRRPGKCIEVGDIGEGNGIAFVLNDLNENFDGQNELTRMSYDFKGKSGGGITPKVRTNPRDFTP